jgi:glycosyltransferase involved in cell wall biosynthesis
MIDVLRSQGDQRIPQAGLPATANVEDPIKLLVWYWGRRGFPVRLVDDFTQEVSGRSCIELSISLSRQSEGFTSDVNPRFPAYHVDTYRDFPSAAAALLRVPRRRRELARFAKLTGAEVVFVPMRHTFGPLVLPRLQQQGQRVLLAVHDALPHPGESYPLWQSHFRLDLHASDGIIVMSHYVADLITRTYDYPRERVFFMALPAPQFTLPRSPRRFPTGRPWQMMFFGRIREYKGLELLAEAYAKLLKRYQISLRIVGEGHVKALETLARLPGVSIENGWIPEHNVPSVLNQADLLVLPYREASQSGILATSFALGIPAVATPVGGIPEQIISGESGLLTTDTTGLALAASIGKLISDPHLYTRCSIGALSAAAHTYSIKRAVDQVINAARILKSMPPRR